MTSQAPFLYGSVIAGHNELGYLTSLIPDALWQCVGVVDSNGGKSTTVLDVQSLVSVEIDQLGSRTSFSFDHNGNTFLRTGARNQPTSYTKDQLNRTSGKLYIDGTRATNTWDAAPRHDVA